MCHSFQLLAWTFCTFFNHQSTKNDFLYLNHKNKSDVHDLLLWWEPFVVTFTITQLYFIFTYLYMVVFLLNQYSDDKWRNEEPSEKSLFLLFSNCLIINNMFFVHTSYSFMVSLITLTQCLAGKLLDVLRLIYYYLKFWGAFFSSYAHQGCIYLIINTVQNISNIFYFNIF